MFSLIKLLLVSYLVSWGAAMDNANEALNRQRVGWYSQYLAPQDTQARIRQTPDSFDHHNAYSSGGYPRPRHENCVRGDCYCVPFTQEDVSWDLGTDRLTIKPDLVRNAVIDILRMRGSLALLGPVIAFNWPLLLEALKFYCTPVRFWDRALQSYARSYWSVPNAISFLLSERGIDRAPPPNTLSLGMKWGGQWFSPLASDHFDRLRQFYPRMSITSACVNAILDTMVFYTKDSARGFGITAITAMLVMGFYCMKDYRFFPSPTTSAVRIPAS